MKKFEATFVFVALIIVALLVYGVAGNFLSGDGTFCKTECGNITLKTADACVFNSTYVKKDFFMQNICPPNQEAVCEKQFCGIVSYVDQTSFDRCMKLCAR